MAQPAEHRFGDARDYPYDPKANVGRLQGLEKLRAVPDRGLAQYLYDLWRDINKPGKQEQIRKQAAADAEESRRRDEDHLDSMCDKALAGVYGPAAKDLANEHLSRGRGPEATRRLRIALQQLETRSSG